MANAPDTQANPAPPFPDLFAALPVAVLAIDAQGRVRFANSAAEQLLNQSERAMLGRPLALLVSLPNGYAERREELGFAAFDCDIARKRGGRLRVDFIEALVPDYPGWRVLTLHEVIATRAIGQPDRGAGRAAVAAAAMLAHEIKNPLSGIRGAAQLISGADRDTADLTQLIIAEVDRVAALIDRMQDFTDGRPLNLAPHNVYPLLDHARRVAEAGFAANIVIEERFDPSLPEVMLDRDAMLQVVLNLLKNACEATAGQAHAEVALATAYRHGMSVSAGPGRPRRALPIEFSVIDNGPGAPVDIADHLFDPFVTGRSGGQGQGQGLGLALVDKLVRDMGGIVQYAREGVPERTIFRVFLPRAMR
ncbi:MAG: two-component system sensor histidine kinase NtrB [Sphingomonas sp.]